MSCKSWAYIYQNYFRSKSSLKFTSLALTSLRRTRPLCDNIGDLLATRQRLQRSLKAQKLGRSSFRGELLVLKQMTRLFERRLVRPQQKAPPRANRKSLPARLVHRVARLQLIYRCSTAARFRVPFLHPPSSGERRHRASASCEDQKWPEIITIIEDAEPLCVRTTE